MHIEESSSDTICDFAEFCNLTWDSLEIVADNDFSVYNLYHTDQLISYVSYGERFIVPCK